MKQGILENQVRKVIPILGVVTVGAIAVLGSATTAKAADISAGFDYLLTPGNRTTYVDLGTQTVGGQEINIGRVDLKGVPLSGVPGTADTIVQRQNDCTFVAGSCNVNIEMTQLSLASIDNLDFGGSDFQVLVSLQGASMASTGHMTINQDGTFHTLLDVHSFLSVVSIDNPGTVVASFGVWKEFQAWGKWKLNANGKFMFTDEVIHIADAAHHVVVPVPEPLTMLGAATALGFGSFFKRKLAKKDKA